MREGGDMWGMCVGNVRNAENVESEPGIRCWRSVIAMYGSRPRGYLETHRGSIIHVTLKYAPLTVMWIGIHCFVLPPLLHYQGRCLYQNNLCKCFYFRLLWSVTVDNGGTSETAHVPSWITLRSSHEPPRVHVESQRGVQHTHNSGQKIPHGQQAHHAGQSR